MTVCRVLLVLAALGGCSDDIQVPPAANPLGTTDNILPYPSSLYEKPDGAGGVVLDVPIGAFPLNKVTGEDFDPTPLARRHGWPATSTMLWAVTGGVDSSELVPHTQIATSLTDASTTVVVDMTTGERLAHFAEVDANEPDNLDLQAVYIRPAARLPGGHRIAVGIRNSLRGADGRALPVTAGFRAVLDDHDTGHARLDAARPRLREAVAALEAAGVPRGDLVVAWDFTVVPDEAALAEPLQARDAALAAMGDGGANLTYSVTSDMGTIAGDPRIARRLEIDFQSPAIAGDANTGYIRDAAGNVVAQGTMTANAYAMVPPCAAFDNKAGILIYGHGIFGSVQELRDGEYARDLSADGCLIVIGTNWTGMSRDDIPNALLALTNLNNAWGFGEHIMQGIINAIALETLARGKLATELFVDGQGRSIVDPTRVYFLGISLGHVLGASYFGYDPFITRGVLHVGGANWSLMFERSNSWAGYGLPLKGSYDHLLDAVIMEQVLQMGLEAVDGATVAGIAVPGAAANKQYLLQTSLHDASVPNLASFFHARSLGLPILSSSVTLPWGFDAPVDASTTGGYVVVDEKPAKVPPETNEVINFNSIAHENPRRRALLQQQMREFWSTGTVANTCTGACDCAAGNCGELHTAMYGGS